MDDLFDWADRDGYPDRPGFEKGSSTSQAASDSLDETMLSKLRLAVWRYVRGCLAGATCDEVEIALEMRHQTASARLRELELFGWVLKTDTERRTRSGRGAKVYLAKQ